MVDYTNATGYQTDSSGRRQFVDRDDANGVQGTSLIADDRNQDRNALVDLVKAAGLTPSGTDDTQVTQAVQYFCKKAASGAVLGSPGVLATGDVAGSVLYYSAALAAPTFTYGSTTVGLATTTALTSALGNYLPLTGGILSGDLHRSGDAGTNRQIFLDTAGKARWAFGADAANESGDNVGSDFFLSRFDDAGNFIDTPVTAERSTGVWAFKYSPRVPDVVDFTTQGALGARVAEGRYIRSVPAARSGNIQIADIEFDASRNVLVTDAAGNVTTFYPQNVTQGTVNGQLYLSYKIAPNLLVQKFYTGSIGTSSGPKTVLYPTAYKAGTIPHLSMSIPTNSEDSYQTVPNFNGSPTIPSAWMSSTGFTVYAEDVTHQIERTVGFFVTVVGEIL